MLPRKASRDPRPRRLRRRLATKATATPYQGPRNTAHRTFTMCCTGAHLLEKTGKENRLPTTATAHSTPARASFLVEMLLMTKNSFDERMAGRKRRSRQRLSPCRARHGRIHLRLRRNAVEAHWPPLTPEHGFPSLLGRPGPRRSPSARSRMAQGRRKTVFSPRSFLKGSGKNGGDPPGPPAASARMMTSYGGNTHIRWRVEAVASSQPNGSPVFLRGLLWHRQPELIRGGKRKREKIHGLPLQCGKKRRILNNK